jgi:hypothetical protein
MREDPFPNIAAVRPLIRATRFSKAPFPITLSPSRSLAEPKRDGSAAANLPTKAFLEAVVMTVEIVSKPISPTG